MSEKETNTEQRAARRRAFQKREQIMRKGITDALGMLMAIPDDTGKIGEVGAHLAAVLSKEAAVVVPTGHGDGTWVNKGEVSSESREKAIQRGKEALQEMAEGRAKESSEKA